MMGHLLLQNAGLTPQERTTVLASTRNKLDLDEITTALKEQWQNWTLKERDQRRRNWQPRRRELMYEKEESDDEPDDEAHWADPEDFTDSGEKEEIKELMLTLEEQKKERGKGILRQGNA